MKYYSYLQMIIGYVLIFVVVVFVSKLLFIVYEGSPISENRTMFRYMGSGSYGLPILLGFMILAGAIMVNGALKNLKPK